MASFAELFRGSKFATFDPAIKQVYTTPQVAKRVGDWGLKRNLPYTWKSNFITVDAFDTQERQTSFDSALSQVFFKIRLCTNFGYTAKTHWSGFSASQPRMLAHLSQKEFNQLVKAAKARKAEWEALPNTQRSKLEDMLRFLNLDSSTSYKLSKAPPCYRSKPESHSIVQGRILNRLNTGTYAIGINGLVGRITSLDLRNTQFEGARSHLGQLDFNEFNHELRTFSAIVSGYSADGIPHISLSTYNPNAPKAPVVDVNAQFVRILNSLERLKEKQVKILDGPSSIANSFRESPSVFASKLYRKYDKQETLNSVERKGLFTPRTRDD